jgi:hypothetical protein
MNTAVKLALDREAYGFFYQQHTNTYQIVGFFASKEDFDSGTKVAHGHKRGAIAFLGTKRQLWGGISN